MLRRPPGHVAHQRKLLLALALFLFNPALRLVEAQQQQPPQPDSGVSPGSPRILPRVEDHVRQPQPVAAVLGTANKNGGDALLDDSPSPRRRHSARNAAAASYVSPSEVEAESFLASRLIDTPKIQRKRTLTEDGHRGRPDSVLIHHDPSVETTSTAAPDLSVRAPSPAYRDPTAAPGHGLASPHHARSLADWKVEDYVLLATVDGDLYSVDRKTGKILWHIESEKPVVQTEHHRWNVSALEESFSPLDHWIWAIEPNQNGAIYLMIPGSHGMAETGLSMKSLIDQMPYYDPNNPVYFTGAKGYTMVTLDAVTGRIRDWYDVNDVNYQRTNDSEMPDSCMRPSDFDDMGEECWVGGTITLGRTDYTIVVRRNDGVPLATLKYSEWGPNNFDKDLHEQYQVPSDHRYVSGMPNGDVYGFSFDPVMEDVKLSFSHSLAAPVARVFDIARPPGVPLSSNPGLAVLPQPPPPAEDDETARLRRNTIFMNETKGGSWYALSGTAYPLILDVPAAECTKDGWWDYHKSADPAEFRDALTGKHSLSTVAERQRALGLDDYPTFPTLPGGDASSTVYKGAAEDSASNAQPTVPDDSDPSPYVIAKVKELPQVAANSVLDFFSNPVFFIAMATLLFFYQAELRRWYSKQKLRWFDKGFAADLSEEDDVSEHETPAAAAAPTHTAVSAPAADGQAKDVPLETVKSSEVVPGMEPPLASYSEPTAPDPGETAPAPAAAKNAADAPADANSPLADGAASSTEVAVPEKKKAHRGRRGGTKHKKGAKLKTEASLSRGDEPQPATVDEVIHQAKGLGETVPNLEPDIVTMPSNVQEVSGPILRIGSLEVNEDQQLGTGSNGTIVFAGRFDGRDVAVKRMLVQFYDIASQETKLLRESDDHPNVIRYYAQQQRAAFHYIALELCQASLAEVIEKPYAFRELAMAGEQDLPNVLYQITSGLNHLHGRSIVHRDLKPQNILVNMGPDGKPRLLISDFGLCKKLENGQTSFGATTAHAAGTSGWRAPELLLDDDLRDHGATYMEASSAHSGGPHSGGPHGASSGTHPGENRDGLPSRRATRAIDIFSLGLVFFYVLTKGSHPFDCGDRYMREVNIRHGNYNLDALDALGDFSYEAKDLIRHMLSANPRHRPKTKEVMSHPFFWPAKKRLAFLCDVSDHFEKEPRDPPSEALERLECDAKNVCHGDFLRQLPKEFIESLGKQRKYTPTRLLDLLRALRNKRNHYEDMSEFLRKMVGPLPDGYLGFWTRRFPNLLIVCWTIGLEEGWESTDRFADYYTPAGIV